MEGCLLPWARQPPEPQAVIPSQSRGSVIASQLRIAVRDRYTDCLGRLGYQVLQGGGQKYLSLIQGFVDQTWSTQSQKGSAGSLPLSLGCSLLA